VVNPQKTENKGAKDGIKGSRFRKDGANLEEMEAMGKGQLMVVARSFCKPQ